MSVTYEGSEGYALARSGTWVYAAPVRTIGENILAAMDRSGKDRKLLAKELGRAYTTISDVVNTRGGITVARLMKYAVVLKTSVESLIDGTDERYERAKRDAPWHTLAVEAPVSHKVGAHVASQAQTRALEERVTELERDLAAARTFIEQFGKLADEAAGQNRPVEARSPKRRRRH